MVYVVHECVPDMEKELRPHGRIKVLLQKNEGNRPVKTMLPLLVQGLKDMKDGDILVCAGDPVAIGLAFAVASGLVEEFTAFRFDRMRQSYHQYSINSNEIDEQVEQIELRR